MSYLFLFFAFVRLLIQTRGRPTVPYGFRSAKHVLVIGIDGLGAVYLNNATHLLPNFSLFYKNGSAALTGIARSEMIAVSAPNWAAAITGMSPSQSGIIDNSWTPSEGSKERNEEMRKCSMCSNNSLEITPSESIGDVTVTVPSLNINGCATVTYEPSAPTELHRISSLATTPEPMWVSARKQNPLLKVAVVYSWAWIRHFVSSQTVDWSHNCKGNDKECIEKLIEFISEGSPQLSFLHLDSIDSTAHLHGFGSQQYYTVLKKVDSYIGQLLEALQESNKLNTTLIMITSDHGGYRKYHGHFNEENIFIPALFLGPGVRRGASLTNFISLIDFGPTALNALGLKPGVHMRGHVIKEIYAH
ncbi:PREDICTED: uncharacterized protein LOC105313051 [Amphimedon queenslandica]|uniref:Sulfatase N-terminal domain-containing protein n=1 Tax=Amphimedon queenslandica TaxID=400682 RepID=A0A1X7UPK1_AMPQE|nr:PREDICTED: uncharacterized protein LOC105313051 [Amphimedon queenslandica]|eukprot:XP_011404473.1 PREDICTED: uncharacterized protein LOC105313051 [Amphimedon queenslandica]